MKQKLNTGKHMEFQISRGSNRAVAAAGEAVLGLPSGQSTPMEDHEASSFYDEIPPLFFVLADAFCTHLKSEDAAGIDVILEQSQIFGLCFASGISQRNWFAMREASNYILVSLGLEPDPLEESLKMPLPQRKNQEQKQEKPGHVYILTNPSFPELVKIGYTCMTVAARVRQLSSSTSTPTPFVITASFTTDTPVTHEARIHALLAAYRMPGREFFSVPESNAIATCKAVIGGVA
ncbi:MAG: GIY-YIG nuclease family protein [Giesbergeria sp.]|uniref:GIY-YIG nuclease family protein n=1 Tax=Giesbergeria sp. TaxID=2818473 RepID=UPI002633C150|nr:GIY-YIG nuclease family protein [Giesbergeria sp.]MDD2610669.1 GIY-YIG nuclease family protein [Giesbergeria sp.]